MSFTDASTVKRLRFTPQQVRSSMLVSALGQPIRCAAQARHDCHVASNAEVIGGALCLPAALRLTQVNARLRAPIQSAAEQSYALYLMHLTILVDLVERQVFEPGWLSPSGCAALAILLPFPLPELLYRLLVVPILRRRPPQRRLAHRAAVGIGIPPSSEPIAAG